MKITLLIIVVIVTGLPCSYLLITAILGFTAREQNDLTIKNRVLRALLSILFGLIAFYWALPLIYTSILNN